MTVLALAIKGNKTFNYRKAETSTINRIFWRIDKTHKVKRKKAPYKMIDSKILFF